VSTISPSPLGSRSRTRLKPLPFLDLSRMSDEVREEVLAAWAELTRTGQFVGGDAVTRFEEDWAAFCGTRFAVGVANGTDALHLALRALDIGPGDEVVVPANTFVATAEAVVLAGARPRFADVDEDTLLVTPESIEAAVTPATRAVIVVHLYGQMPDMDAIGAVAERHGLLVVEDAAQAQGAAWRGRRAGSDIGFVVTRRLGFGRPVPDEYVDFTDEMLASTPIEVVADFFPDFAVHDKFQALGALERIPTVVLGGSEDAITPVTHTRRIAEALPSAELVELPGVGHMTPLEAADEVDEALAKLLQRATDGGEAR